MADVAGWFEIKPALSAITAASSPLFSLRRYAVFKSAITLFSSDISCKSLHKFVLLIANILKS
ncbi:MAG: hypothetical protein ACD_79C01459G0001 [uncultured bacterium]|nr:MAG: hypothetical protein ACD_79C01459G0001 [uncultured bacterium]